MGAGDILLKIGIFGNLLLLISGLLLDTVQDYKGFQVFRLQVNSSEALNVLNELQESGNYDFWKEPEINSTTDIMVAPEQNDDMLSLIQKLKIEHQILYQNLDAAIASERKTMVTRLGTRMSWTGYHRLDTIYEWMHSLAKTHRINESVISVEVIEIGQSFEGRPMKVLKISRNWKTINGVKRTGIWMDAGIHAREWIAPATVTYVTNEIIEANLKQDIWASAFDWYIAPVINPDGYEYSHTNDRFWRKTRSYPRPGNSIIDSLVNLCMGADPNRNWNYHWGGPGGSGNPCAPNYRGRDNASEVEVQNLQNFILSRKDDLRLYLSLHSYSQLILIPWGHSYDLAEDHNDMLKVALKAQKRLQRVQGTYYRTGSTAHILYPASGGSHDWAKGVAGIKYSYTVELPDRGFYGFLLPPTRIKTTGQETLELVKSMAEDMVDIYYYNDTTRQ